VPRRAAKTRERVPAIALWAMVSANCCSEARRDRRPRAVDEVRRHAPNMSLALIAFATATADTPHSCGPAEEQRPVSAGWTLSPTIVQHSRSRSFSRLSGGAPRRVSRVALRAIK
jgi:hypothetical protein